MILIISGVYGRGSTYCALEILLKGGASEKGPLNTMDLDHLLTVRARVTYVNYVLTMVSAGACLYAQHMPVLHALFASGIHIFMAFYGFCVFLEAPQHLRKGRKRYIAASFVMTFIVTFAASLDMAETFQELFQSTSPSHWLGLLLLGVLDWKTKLSHTGQWILVWIGDVLLVSACHHNPHAYRSWNVFTRCIVAM
jgi:hypothetical protein